MKRAGEWLAAAGSHGTGVATALTAGIMGEIVFRCDPIERLSRHRPGVGGRADTTSGVFSRPLALAVGKPLDARFLRRPSAHFTIPVVARSDRMHDRAHDHRADHCPACS